MLNTLPGTHLLAKRKLNKNNEKSHVTTSILVIDFYNFVEYGWNNFQSRKNCLTKARNKNIQMFSYKVNLTIF